MVNEFVVIWQLLYVQRWKWSVSIQTSAVRPLPPQILVITPHIQSDTPWICPVIKWHRTRLLWDFVYNSGKHLFSRVWSSSALSPVTLVHFAFSTPQRWNWVRMENLMWIWLKNMFIFFWVFFFSLFHGFIEWINLTLRHVISTHDSSV